MGYDLLTIKGKRNPSKHTEFPVESPDILDSKDPGFLAFYYFVARKDKIVILRPP